jgi:hypothetical protein
LEYLLAGFLGAAVAASELVSRYRDKPRSIFGSIAGWIYIALNAIAACAALGLMHIFGWGAGTFPSDPTGVKREVLQAIAAGALSMAFLRSSFLTVRIDGRDVGLGLVLVIQAFLRAADSAVDRQRGRVRDQIVGVMDEISFVKARGALPAYCLGLMQNISPEDQRILGVEIDKIAKMREDDVVKCRLLGLAILNLCGEDLLLTAVESLKQNIGRDIPALGQL